MKKIASIETFLGKKVLCIPVDSNYQQEVYLDINKGSLVHELSYLSNYLNSFIKIIIGIESTVDADNFSKSVFNVKPVIDFSVFEGLDPIEIELDDELQLILDTELIDTKSELINLVTNATSSTEIVDAIKSKFNLIDAIDTTDEIVTDGKSPASIRPSNLTDITKLFSNYLISKDYVKGNCVEFDILSPISDFKVSGLDTPLMVEIRNFYSSWVRIEVSELVMYSEVISECLPISDPNIYMKVGNSYVKVPPTDIQVSIPNQNPIALIQDGLTLPRVVVNNGSGYINLSISNLRLLTTDNVQIPLTGVKFNSPSLGILDSSLYFKDASGNYNAVPGLSSSLAMWKKSNIMSSSTKFKFYFK